MSQVMNPTIRKSFDSAIVGMERLPRLIIWFAVLCALLLLAGYALLASLLTSMEILEFSVKIPWATMIATYIFLVAIGSGLCIINALGSVFGMQRYEMMTKRMAFLSLTTIVFGMLCIVLHLGHPERMPIYNAISPNFRSAISWMGLLYSIYMAVVVGKLWLLSR
jgi:molybdopterin-containing oxidoreductase family membrane subunit